MFDLSDLFDPSKYSVSKNPTRRNYNYSVTVNFLTPINGKTSQNVVVASNDILSESQIIEQANFYAIVGKYGASSEDIGNIEITGATRSSALG